MSEFGITWEQSSFMFCRSKDSLFTLATTLRPHELDTFSTKCLTMSGPQCPVAQSSDNVKNEYLVVEDSNCNNNEKNHSYSCQTENGARSSPKRPGWFGKGYAKAKKPSKKRRLR